MANSEAQFRQELLKDARKLGYHAEPNVSDFDIGRPDCFIKALDFPTIWIELKFIRSVGRKINLSAQQRNWAKKHRSVGGHSMWAVCVKLRVYQWELYVGTEFDEDVTHVKHGELLQCKGIGETWDVDGLLRLTNNRRTY
jgi:hypothetical protein